MPIDFFEFFLLGLACFRLTRLFVYDRITAFIREKFMEEMEEEGPDGEIEVYLVPKKGLIKGFFGELLSCYWCTGIWSAIVLALFYYFLPVFAQPIILVLAVAGLGAVIETIIQRMMT